MNIDFVVAPYEADAQLAYLEKIGLIQAIITEDSDLLVFGSKRVQLIFILYIFSKSNSEILIIKINHIYYLGYI